MLHAVDTAAHDNCDITLYYEKYRNYIEII